MTKDKIDAIPKWKITSAIKDNEWDYANSILYTLCSDKKYHTEASVVIAKVWLIGRAYAAAIERRKLNFGEGDEFYTKNVAPKILKSEIDNWLNSLECLDVVNEDNLSKILDIHLRVTKLFNEISGLEKRSLASKYLHFHFPNLFFIYDSRVVSAISRLSPITGRVGKSKYKNTDNEYRKYCEKCLFLRNYIKKKFNIVFTPRQLDNLLLNIEQHN